MCINRLVGNSAIVGLIDQQCCCWHGLEQTAKPWSTMDRPSCIWPSSVFGNQAVPDGGIPNYVAFSFPERWTGQRGGLDINDFAEVGRTSSKPLEVCVCGVCVFVGVGWGGGGLLFSGRSQLLMQIPDWKNTWVIESLHGSDCFTICSCKTFNTLIRVYRSKVSSSL